ncbi:general stress protein [Bacillus testis]|uniref:general stress protein n=1 Tax=Bacillus testis TaxID=1622072 RepID=UPI00067ED258|nr:general stress protein [Bacillus testis]
MNKVEVVENGIQAKEKIDELNASGYTKENIYIFAHDKDRSEHLTENTDTESVGIKEQGMLDAMGNMFRSRGDELRSKMQNLGLTADEAAKYEEQLDYGKVVIVVAQ